MQVMIGKVPLKTSHSIGYDACGPCSLSITPLQIIIKVPADKSNIDILCHKSMDRLQHE